MSRLRKFLRIWAIVGSAVLVVFFLWVAIGYRPSAEARAALVSDARVTVSEDEDAWSFVPGPGAERREVALLFFPGALVDARAYASVLREIAAAGYPAFLISVPMRGAFGTADRPEVRGRARRIMARETEVRAWVAGGHSRGAKVASLLARDNTPPLSGLLLVGSTHPRDFSLAELEIPVTKVYGDRDGVAPIEAVEANRHLLPSTTTWVLIEGGNHGQFGSYGFQPMDRFADIEPAKQQALTVDAAKRLLELVERNMRFPAR